MQSHIPRRSSQIPRRSSSADGMGNLPANLLNQMTPSLSQNITNVSRSSSIGYNNRQSSIGSTRQSSIGSCLKPSFSINKPGEKSISASDIANSILRVLQDLDYKSQPMSIKVLLQPSTSTFYSIFEFFLKFIGVEDVWNADLLLKVKPQQNPSSQPINSNANSASQNVIAQNKARVELIAFYLNLLRFNNIPKPNVLQTMTTPKNWIQMLQILQFLANNCWFMCIYDGPKLLNQMDSKNKSQILFEYLKKAYNMGIQDQQFIQSESHKKLKEESKKRYEKQFIGANNLEELKAERDSLKVKFEQLNETRNELENDMKEEQELITLLNEEEKLLNEEKTAKDERKKRIESIKTAIIELKSVVNKMNEQLIIKDADYDRQLASGKKVDNLSNRHAQKLQELETLQNTFVDLENKKDELQMKLIQKTQEVKDAIANISELVNKIKLSSSLAINEFPQLDVMDFHKKNDLIKEFKESLLEIRKEYNLTMCKLPEQMSKCREEKKIIENKIELENVNIQKLEGELQHYESIYKKLKQDIDEGKSILQNEREGTKNKLSKLESSIDQVKEETSLIMKEFQKAKEEQRKIGRDLEIQLGSAKKCTEETENLSLKQVEEAKIQLIKSILARTLEFKEVQLILENIN